MKWRVGIVVLALSTVSCGASESSDTTTTASPTAPPPPPSAAASEIEGSYESVQAMMKDVESSFYLCTAPIKIYDPPLADGALAEADCSSDVSFLIFEPDAVQTHATVLQQAAEGTSVLIVGDNWIIDCSSDTAACERIQGATGGELIVSTP